MTLPKGNVWQELRKLALDTLPPGTQCKAGLALPLNAWLQRGAYTVTGATKSAITLSAPNSDVGALLFSEAGLLLDHAQEHALQLRNQLAGGRWYSPAWQSVSTYYWAYYAVMALTRMIGRAPIWLGDSEAATLTGIGPPGTKINPGPRMLICGPSSSATMREVVIKRSSQTRVHDAVWKTWFQLIRDVVQPFQKDRSNAPELRLYIPQISVANILGDSWPSEYRNIVNYVPGGAYGAARGRTPTAGFNALSHDVSLSAEAAVERLENAASAVARTPVREQLLSTTKVMIYLTMALHSIANELFNEVVDRRELDARWISARRQLRRTQWSAFAAIEWPVDGSAA